MHSVDYRYIIHSKADVMATKGYSFQDDEKTIIDIDIDMDIVAQREKLMNEKNILK